MVRVDRVHRHQGNPFMADTAVLPSAHYERIPDELGSYRLLILAQQNGILLGRAEEKATIILAGPGDAKSLAVAEGTPLLRLERTVFAVDGRAVEWRVARCHLGAMHYHADMS